MIYAGDKIIAVINEAYRLGVRVNGEYTVLDVADHPVRNGVVGGSRARIVKFVGEEGLVVWEYLKNFNIKHDEEKYPLYTKTVDQVVLGEPAVFWAMDSGGRVIAGHRYYIKGISFDSLQDRTPFVTIANSSEQAWEYKLEHVRFFDRKPSPATESLREIEV